MIEEIPFNTCQGSDAAQQSAEWIGGLHNTAHMKCVNLAGAYRESFLHKIARAGVLWECGSSVTSVGYKPQL